MAKLDDTGLKTDFWLEEGASPLGLTTIFGQVPKVQLRVKTT